MNMQSRTVGAALFVTIIAPPQSTDSFAVKVQSATVGVEAAPSIHIAPPPMLAVAMLAVNAHCVISGADVPHTAIAPPSPAALVWTTHSRIVGAVEAGEP